MKKSILILILLLIIFINFILRYPSIPNEIGEDSWQYHALSSQISRDKTANWVINPLSIFGYYPPYEEVGVVYLISGINQLTGVFMDYSILLASILISIFSIIITFVFTFQLFHNQWLGLLSALIFSTMRRIIGFTSWTIGQRVYFYIFIIVLLFLLIRIITIKYNRRMLYISLLLLLMIPIASMHTSSILIPIILIIYIISIKISKFKKSIHFNINSRFTIYVIFTLFILTFIFSFLLTSSLKFSPLGSENIFDPKNPFNYFLNVVVRISIWVGFPIIFFPIGLFFYPLYKKIDAQNIFLISLILFMFLFFTYLLYITNIFMILISLMISIGVYYLSNLLYNGKKFNFTQIILPFSIVFLIFLPQVVTIETSDILLGHEDYNRIIGSSLYYEYKCGHNDPLYGYGVRSSVIQAEANIDVMSDDYINKIIKRHPTFDIHYFIEKRQLFRLSDSYYDYLPSMLVKSLNNSDIDKFINISNTRYLFLHDFYNDTAPSGILENGLVYTFYHEVIIEKYKEYDNGLYKIYYLW